MIRRRVRFFVVTGRERFKITDLSNGGESFADDKIKAYKFASILARLRRPFRIEDRKNQTTVTAGDYPVLGA